MRILFLSAFDPLTNSLEQFLLDPCSYVDSSSSVEIALIQEGELSPQSRENLLSRFPIVRKTISKAEISELSLCYDSVVVPALEYPFYQDQIDPKKVILLGSNQERKQYSFLPFCNIPSDQSREQQLLKEGKAFYASKEALEAILNEDCYFLPKLRKRMKESRYSHSKQVALTCYDIAKANGLNANKAFLAGIYHDNSKDYSDEVQIQYLKEHQREVLPCPSFALHQFTGALLVKEDFGIRDPLVRDAIACHCTGKKEMNSFEKCLFVADKTEPTRPFETERERNIALMNIEEGFLAVLRSQIDYFKRKNIPYLEHELTKEMVQHYLGKDSLC